MTAVTSADLGLLALGIAVGCVFAARGAQKVFGWWCAPGMAGWSTPGLRETWDAGDQSRFWPYERAVSELIADRADPAREA